MSVLYVSDLDGTLLTNEPSLSAFSESALRELLAAGLPFSVASARSVYSMRKMLKGLPLALPVVEFNGAFVTDLETGRHEVVNALEPTVVEEVYRLILGSDFVPFVSTFNGREDCVHYEDVANEGMAWYVDDRIRHEDPRLRRTTDLATALRESVVCMTIIGQLEELIDLESAVGERFRGQFELHLMENQYARGWHWLTIHDRRATKDRGVRTLMDLCGIADRELIVFGDHVNDINIFRTAAHAVAVANAMPDLKRHATQVIGSNEEDSVVKFIREHWSGELGTDRSASSTEGTA